MNPDAADLAMKWAALNMARQQKLNRNSPAACRAVAAFIHSGTVYAEACAEPFAPEAPPDPSPEGIENAYLNRVLPIRRKPGGGGLDGAA